MVQVYRCLRCAGKIGLALEQTSKQWLENIG